MVAAGALTAAAEPPAPPSPLPPAAPPGDVLAAFLSAAAEYDLVRVCM
jgi:hypothetical protein